MLLRAIAMAAVLASGVAFAQTDAAPAAEAAAAAPAVEAAAPTGPMTTDTTPLGDLLDNPATREILAARIPDLIGNPQVEMARGMTLKMLQPYAPTLTDEVLAAVDSDLSQLPSAN